jgi:hypothetical protein
MRLIDADALKELFSEVIGSIAKKPEMNGNLEHMIRASAMVIQMIDDAPTVQPETNCSEFPNNWIPCSERQPDVNGWYITTISGEICGQDRAFSGMSEFANGKWTSGDDVDETEMTIAWMPLPEPYQGGEQE